jgi:hypothetical protein
MLQSIMYNMHIWNFLFAHIIMHQILVDFKNNKWNSIKRIRRRNIVLFLHIKPVCMEQSMSTIIYCIREMSRQRLLQMINICAHKLRHTIMKNYHNFVSRHAKIVCNNMVFMRKVYRH